MIKLISFLKNLKDLSHTNFFLRKHQPTPFTMELLKNIYPTINWKRVDFYEGLPWFTPLVAPYVTAQALPQFYSLGKYRIYIKKFDETQPGCVADIVHEAYHILQYMQIWRGYGLGFFRGMMVFYNAFFVKYGYRQNPFEIPAYDQEYRFMKYCAINNITEIIPDKTVVALKNIPSNHDLISKSFSFKYDYSKIILGATYIFCIGIALSKPIADGLMYVLRIISKPKPTLPLDLTNKV